MASLIETYYAHAQLSDAAYAALTDGMSGDLYVGALRTRGFTTAEATTFAAQYSIVKTFEDPATSFFAVLFQKNGTNEKILAMRGTSEVWDDLAITDLELGFLGITNQNESLKRTYAEMRSYLSPTDTLTVTGHSLGGFLAQIFTVDPAFPVAHTYTFNSPGIESGFSNLAGLFGFSQAIPVDSMTNLVAQGRTFVASTGIQLGIKQNIFIEETNLLVNPIANHLIEPLKDSLALYDVFDRLDPMLSIENITNILNAVSSVPSRSLERGLDGLRTIFQGPSAPLTSTGDRVAYYNNLLLFRDSLPLGPVSPHRVVNLAGTEQGAASLAKSPSSEGLAYRYALRELNPFAVVGASYAIHNVGGALDLYDAQTGNGTMTALYLSDRAELLASMNLVNRHDGGLITGLSSDTHVLDIRTGFEFGSTLTAPNDMIFGDDRVGDVFSGRSGDDHLYGGDGADTIEGLGGADYIEGNAGNDVLLSGGAGNDIILGQQGNDTLNGGADNDRLNGGLGNDRLEGGTGSDQYTYFNGQGQDTINDADKLGSILFDRQVVSEGLHRHGEPDNTWKSLDGRFTFTKQDANLVINNTLTIENFDFTTGALGIHLAEAPNTAAPALPTIEFGANGFPTEEKTPPEEFGSYFTLDLGAVNYIVRGRQGIYLFQSDLGDDQLYGGPRADQLLSGMGNDQLFGANGDDLLIAGEGDDQLDGGIGDDQLQGGLGKDNLSGGDGDDEIFGDAVDGNDTDYLDGGEAKLMRNCAVTLALTP